VGNGNRIEGNNVTDNDYGINVENSGNLIIRNSAGANTTEFQIVAGNTVGPSVTSANIAASTNPHANYEH
jgi:parallel beta-helix repeat protein